MPIAPDDVVTIASPHKAVIALPFEVVHVDEDLLVIDKPPGLITSSTPNEKRPTALAILRAWAAVERPRAKVGLVHRLDADAGGMLVFSLNNAAHASLKRQFADHSARRTYEAIVNARVIPPAGTIRSRLVEHADGTVHTTRSAAHGQDAVTHYQTLGVEGGRTTLKVTLETGRKHQIRSHLSTRGWPIVGDRLYGGEPNQRLLLTAVRLELVHPRTGQPIVFERPADARPRQ